MKKLSGLVAGILLFCCTLLVWSACNKSKFSEVSIFKLISSRFETLEDFSPANRNYCKGCGYSNMDTHGCVGNDCLNVKSGCMVEFAIDLDSSKIATEAHQFDKRDGFHEIRDSFLLKSTLGQWYITYYYELGKVAMDNNMITTSNVVDYLNFATMLVDVVETVRNGSVSSIPIDNSFRDKALGFVSDFRNNTSDTIVLGYLDEIESDLYYFANKDVSFIRSTIGL
jgi:hypothetical protein